MGRASSASVTSSSIVLFPRRVLILPNRLDTRPLRTAAYRFRALLNAIAARKAVRAVHSGRSLRFADSEACVGQDLRLQLTDHGYHLRCRLTNSSVQNVEAAIEDVDGSREGGQHLDDLVVGAGGFDN